MRVCHYYDNTVYAEVNEKQADTEFAMDHNSCYAISSHTGSKSSDEGNKDSCTKKLLLLLFLAFLVLMLGTICACVGFALEISKLKSKAEISSPAVDLSKVIKAELNSSLPANTANSSGCCLDENFSVWIQ